MSRKTVKISDMVETANYFFLHTPDSMRNERKALQSFVEGFLHECNSYNGFNYLSEIDMQKSDNGITCGIIYKQDTATQERHIFPDDSRVRMFYKR